MLRPLRVRDNDAETEEEEADPLMPMVVDAMQKHKTTFQEMKMNLVCSGLDEQAAGEEAYPNILLERKLTPISWLRTPSYLHPRTYVHPCTYNHILTPTYVHPRTYTPWRHADVIAAILNSN